ncbi:nuclear transport factor 2 family protein [Hwangdonia lutea]|uniref:Nuclear transport factor 2 family protein n=1 Tax=Hwangdonia lutea TaxID=3075823 RepID=A0AA97EQY1_9FLAO|nr:nuclear transport factor 2 family protein [Hwangdonia sp. SCSIO 19198]WOD44575.1 nuclear transport factor 2 family protein [Hwangdonia sp. SCSIO 19198]
MKKVVLMLIFMGSIFAFSQKKNGTVYIEHPAIDVVEAYTKAFVSGDTTKIASLLTDDFKSYNGLSTNPNAKGRDKASFIKGAIRWSQELDYFSIGDFQGAYPDAIEYKKDNKDEVVWVQTWDLLKGVHKKTGVKFSSPVHRLFVVTKDTKIKMLINYFNEGIFNELRQSFSDRTNGTIYNHHDNINTVRKVVYAFENSDLEKALGFFSDDAQFFNINEDFDKPDTMEAIKGKRQGFLDSFEVKNIEMMGYPDYLEYEMGNGRSVLSWWDFHLTRKSDKKEIKLTVHMSHDFDKDGVIISETLYYNKGLLEN